MLNAGLSMLRGLTACLSTAVCGIGGTATAVRFTAPNGAGIDFSINGLMYHKADADDVWTLSGTTVPVSSECIFLLQLDSAGAASIVQGEVVSTADLTSGAKTLKWPQPTVDKCPIGAVRVTTNSSVPFVPGTTNLSAAGITDTYYDFSVVPQADLTS